MFSSQAKSAIQLTQLQHLFKKQLVLSQTKPHPIEMPFYNFICYLVELLSEFVKYPRDNINFNMFFIDHHLRKFGMGNECYRKGMGLINAWKKYAEKQETKLYLSFLKQGRNTREPIKTFLKLRKILLKNLDQKILQEIQLSHGDAVTIIHTIKGVTALQKKSLIRQINEYFLNNNSKLINITKFNAAIICENLMKQIVDQPFINNAHDSILSQQSRQSPNVQIISRSSNKFLSNGPFFTNSQDNHISFKDLSFSRDVFQQNCNIKYANSSNNKQNENSEEFSIHKNSLVDFEQCLKELTILKEKDQQIDNRFKKITKIVHQEP